MNDDEFGARIGVALRARTDDVTGDPQSLERLLEQAPRRRRLPRVGLPLVAAAASVAVIAAGAVAVSDRLPDSSQQATQVASSPLGQSTTAAYPPSAYFVAHDHFNRSVIVRSADNVIVATLPISLMSQQLSTDGKRVYGSFIGSRDGGGVANSCGPKTVAKGPKCEVPPATQRFVARDNDVHLGYLDLGTGRFTTLDAIPWGPAADNVVLASAFSADGSVVAWSAQQWPNQGTVTVHIHAVTTGTHTTLTVPHEHQIPSMTIAPDGSQLVMRVNNTQQGLFTVRLREQPMLLTALTSPPSTCPGDDTYDFPVWTANGLFAQYNCSNDSRTTAAVVVRLDPQTGAQLDVASHLPRGGLDHFMVADGAGGPQFYFLPVLGNETQINTLHELVGTHGRYRQLKDLTADH